MNALTNQDILNLIKGNPTYSNITAGLTDEIFKEAGFEQLEQNNYKLLEDFFDLSVRVILNKIRTANPTIPSSYRSVVEEYEDEAGGILQRIAIHPMKPIDPKYRGLEDGMSIDPFIVRKPKTSERFYRKNFDYANMITIQDINLKQMFLNENGMFNYIEGITRSFNEAYYIQKYEVFRDMLNLAMKSEKAPLQPTQQITTKEITAEDTSTQEEFIRAIHNIASTFKATVMSSNYNAGKFKHSCNNSDYTLLIRVNKYNIIKTGILATTYHTNNLALPFKIEPVVDFGGIEYYNEDNEKLLPVYNDKTGEQIGYNKTGSSEDPLVADEDIVEKDPNENVVAILAQKGVIFATTQNPYTVRSIYNPRGMYTNHFANQPNGSFNYDNTYDIIKITETPSNNKTTKNNKKTTKDEEIKEEITKEPEYTMKG